VNSRSINSVGESEFPFRESNEPAKYLSIALIRRSLDQRALELGNSLDVSGCIPHEQTASMAFGKHALAFGGRYESVDPSIATTQISSISS
jgi:hypothetical protein